MAVGDELMDIVVLRDSRARADVRGRMVGIIWDSSRQERSMDVSGYNLRF